MDVERCTTFDVTVLQEVNDSTSATYSVTYSLPDSAVYGFLGLATIITVVWVISKLRRSHD